MQYPRAFLNLSRIDAYERNEKDNGDYLSKNGDGAIEGVRWRSEGEGFCHKDGETGSAESADGDFC